MAVAVRAGAGGAATSRVARTPQTSRVARIFATRIVTIGLAALLAAGCGSSAGPRVVDPAPEANALLDRGYRADRRFAFEERTERVLDREVAVDLQLFVPTGAATRVPLVVYFPGLAEPPTAARLWRTTWAEAGYAVLLVQPEAYGAGIARSQRARAGDFRGLALEAFSRSALDARVVQARSVVDLVRRRIIEGAAPYDRIDASRIVMAGFHLGAQTAAALGGDRDVAASILLGWSGPPPAPDVSPGAPTRLVVAATGDADPFGGSTRSASAIPAGRLLVLNGGSHALLAGGGYLGPLQAREAMAPGTQARQRADETRRRNNADFERTIAGGDPGAPSLRRLPEREPFDPARIAAVQAVTVAHLDAVVRDSSRARTWLDRDAAVWLGGAATLR